MSAVTVTFLVVKPEVGAVVREIVYVFDPCNGLARQNKINLAIEEISKRGFVVIKFQE